MNSIDYRLLHSLLLSAIVADGGTTVARASGLSPSQISRLQSGDALENVCKVIAATGHVIVHERDYRPPQHIAAVEMLADLQLRLQRGAV